MPSSERDRSLRGDAPERRSVSTGRTGRDRTRAHRRALGVGLAVSGLLHVLLLVFVGSVEIGRRGVRSPPSRAEPPEGLTIIAFELLPPAPEDPEPRRPEEAAPPRTTVRATPRGPGGLPAAEPEAEEGGLTNAERLRPRLGDERLWVDFRDPIRPGSIATDRYAEAVDRLREIVRVWLDSLELSEEQRRRALDWTFGQGDTRWGISPEGLHLGKVTIPIPFGSLFQQAGPLGREAEQAVRDLQEIRAQEIRRQVEETRERRREEMRQRSREEAEGSEDDTTGDGG